MTKPSDFSPDRALEVNSRDISRSVNRERWLLRGAGLILLIFGWLAISARDFGSIQFALNTAVVAILGVYAFVAAAWSRKMAVNMEKKIRLGLLVHNMELESKAMRDELTQLFNRRYLFDRLERELQTAKGFERPLSIVVLDLNDLKAVNDTHGHRTGDKVLAGFGQFLLKRTRASDVPARIGADEFAVILPDTSESAAGTMVRRLTGALENTNLIEEGDLTLQLSVSLGISGYPWGGESVDAIMQQADASLYANKRLRKQDGRLVQPSADTLDGSVPAMFRKNPEPDGGLDTTPAG